MARKIVLSFFAAMCVLTAGSMVREARAAGGFDVCHKGQTITVGSASAVAAHVAHGDYVGSCTVPNVCRQTCNDQFNDCFAAAGGSEAAIAACIAVLESCLAACP